MYTESSKSYLAATYMEYLHKRWGVRVLGIHFQAEEASGLMAGHHDNRRGSRGGRSGEPEHGGDEPVHLGHISVFVSAMGEVLWQLA